MYENWLNKSPKIELNTEIQGLMQKWLSLKISPKSNLWAPK
jgi:hypothetical protein